MSFKVDHNNYIPTQQVHIPHKRNLFYGTDVVIIMIISHSI